MLAEFAHNCLFEWPLTTLAIDQNFASFVVTLALHLVLASSGINVLYPLH